MKAVFTLAAMIILSTQFSYAASTDDCHGGKGSQVVREVREIK